MKKRWLGTAMACLFMVLSATSALAQSSSTENIQDQKHALINTVLTSDNSETVREANVKLNEIIEEEVEQNTTEIEARVGVQIKNYRSTTVSSYGDRMGAYNGSYTTGTSKNIGVTVTVNLGTQYRINSSAIISLGASLSMSASAIINGPGYNTKLPGSNLNATHAVAIAILRGTIIHETYDQYDASTGTLVKHVDHYVIGNPTVTRYNLLVADVVENGRNAYYVGHCSGNKYKKYTSRDAFLRELKSTNPARAYSW